MTPFAKAETSVLSDLENANATAANAQKATILQNCGGGGRPGLRLLGSRLERTAGLRAGDARERRRRIHDGLERSSRRRRNV